LPVHVQPSPSIPTFEQRLKTFLFQQSFSDIIILHTSHYVIVDFQWLLLFLPRYRAYTQGNHRCNQWEWQSPCQSPCVYTAGDRHHDDRQLAGRL